VVEEAAGARAVEEEAAAVVAEEAAVVEEEAAHLRPSTTLHRLRRLLRHIHRPRQRCTEPEDSGLDNIPGYEKYLV